MLNIIVFASALALVSQHEHPVMGFDLTKTAHHFRLTDTGGRIEVTVNNESDATSLAQIRTHLQHIAHEFAAGRFDAPFATHGEVPPGVPAMQARKTAVVYRYEEMKGGGRLVITTTDREALAAVHEFLRYQITEHKTGDAVTIYPGRLVS
jgi:hypothetical protein